MRQVSYLLLSTHLSERREHCNSARAVETRPSSRVIERSGEADRRTAHFFARLASHCSQASSSKNLLELGSEILISPYVFRNAVVCSSPILRLFRVDSRFRGNDRGL